MPYIPSAQMACLEEERAELEPFIATLVAGMVHVETKTDLFRVDVKPLARKIRELALRKDNYGAFAGPLNYACHVIFLRTLPEVRYWTMAISTGWLRRVAQLFRTYSLHEILFIFDKRHPDLTGVPTELRFKHITENILVRLAWAVAPDYSIDASDIIAGIFHHIDEEFYRIVGSVYEDRQIAKNGHLWEYIQLREKISSKKV